MFAHCLTEDLCLLYFTVHFELTYGTTTQQLDVPDENLLNCLIPHEHGPFHDTDAELKLAAEACAGFLGPAQRVLVLVNDYTRPTPNHVVLDALEPALAGRDVHYLVCLGTHRPPHEYEYEQVFGPGFMTQHGSHVLNHDCLDRSRLFFLGRTGFGTEVWFNRELLWAERVITINSIEPHYFAGFTGGRKGFLPGVAAQTTIAQNHSMVTAAGSAVFALEGNPVHEDMTEAARMIPRPVFSVQLVQAHDHRLLAVHWGDLFRSFATATQHARQVFAVTVARRADIIVSVLQAPYDINFYQAQRAVEFARPVLAPRAAHITVTACRDGVGNDGFIKTFQQCRTPADVLAQPHHDATLLGWHKSARLAQIMATTELYVVAGIDDAVVRAAFMTPFRTVQEAFDAALRKAGPEAAVYVIPDAGSVVPVLNPT